MLEGIKDLLYKYVYVEDNEVRIKNGIKYDIFNMLDIIDPLFIKELLEKKGWEEDE